VTKGICANWRTWVQWGLNPLLEVKPSSRAAYNDDSRATMGLGADDEHH
jgi:hypothetical protein